MYSVPGRSPGRKAVRPGPSTRPDHSDHLGSVTARAGAARSSEALPPPPAPPPPPPPPPRPTRATPPSTPGSPTPAAPTAGGRHHRGGIPAALHERDQVGELFLVEPVPQPRRHAGEVRPALRADLRDRHRDRRLAHVPRPD